MGEMLDKTSSDNFFQQANRRKNSVHSFAFVIAAVFCVLLCCVFALPVFYAEGHITSIELNEKLNPNSAPAGSLIRLPGIGMGRAHAIITYRQGQQGRGERAFEGLGDLQNVKGIGVKTAENINRWVDFEQK
jgi:DNA uptake protein ComE-like DNA-binding protein